MLLMPNRYNRFNLKHLRVVSNSRDTKIFELKNPFSPPKLTLSNQHRLMQIIQNDCLVKVTAHSKFEEYMWNRFPVITIKPISIRPLYNGWYLRRYCVSEKIHTTNCHYFLEIYKPATFLYTYIESPCIVHPFFNSWGTPLALSTACDSWPRSSNCFL